MVTDEPRQASLRRLRRFGIRPNRELGQNFLIDDNILGVIERAAELDPADVVLEVGGGLGVLSEHLAARVAHLHVVEVDRSLEPPLAEALEPFANTTLHLADAVALDLATLDPAPGKVVANLPYGVAATVLLKSIAELPDARLWVAMTQREVGERLAAAPGSKTYGATSVLAQLACEVRVLRRIPRTVFHPEPNVESALVLLRRRAPAPPPELDRAGPFRLRAPAQGAGRLAGPRPRRPGRPARRDPRGAHRARPSGGRAGGADPPRRLAAPGRRDRTRAPRGAATAMSAPVDERAFAKLNLLLHVGRRRPDGLHPLGSIFASIDLCDDIQVEPADAPGDRVECAGLDGANLADEALAAFRRRVPELPPLRVRIDKRIPVAAGLGGGSADAAAVLRAANRHRRATHSTRRRCASSAPGWAPTSPARSIPGTPS